MFGFLILHREDEMSKFMEEIREESLEVITVDPAVEKDFYAVNEKEIYYRGSLYDVKTKIQKNGKLIFRCEKDMEELYSLRSAIEELAVQILIKNINAKKINKLESIVASMIEASQAKDLDKMIERLPA